LETPVPVAVGESEGEDGSGDTWTVGVVVPIVVGGVARGVVGVVIVVAVVIEGLGTDILCRMNADWKRNGLFLYKIPS
jgi:hypothetical protein